MQYTDYQYCITKESEAFPDNPDQPTLLVIDDNEDIRALLHELLSESYCVILAINGADGLDKARIYVPDLIICDVMMPVMDGLEFSKIIKSELSTSHIPILMLTACAMDEQRAMGYEVGADAYLSKPFNYNVLITRCRNLIENRKRIRTLWLTNSEDSSQKVASASKSENITEPKSRSLFDIDSDFYRKFIELFNRQINKPDLEVDSIASDLGLTYNQLYRKIKSLTNYRPVELIRILRLEKAKELLLNSEKTISEISYEVGFSSPGYFTRCYRQHYGETPSETRGTNEEKTE